MLPFKKIVCPTDFSEPSYEALEVAKEFVGFFSAELILVHVVTPIHVIPASPDPSMGVYASSYVDDMNAMARKKLDEIVKEKIPHEVKHRTIITHGSAAEEIVRVATEENADIIIIATHGLTGWRHLVFGSVAEKVVRLAPCAVLTIRIHGPKES